MYSNETKDQLDKIYYAKESFSGKISIWIVFRKLACPLPIPFPYHTGISKSPSEKLWLHYQGSVHEVSFSVSQIKTVKNKKNKNKR